MITCDLCGQTKECIEREIEGKTYDICPDCWNPLASKLEGKGRPIKKTEIVLLPPAPQTEPTEPKPQLPWQPPKIWDHLA